YLATMGLSVISSISRKYVKPRNFDESVENDAFAKLKTDMNQPGEAAAISRIYRERQLVCLKRPLNELSASSWSCPRKRASRRLGNSWIPARASYCQLGRNDVRISSGFLKTL